MEAVRKYSEEELVACLREQDKQAFSYLYDTYAPILGGVIYKMVGERELTQDLLQEVFIKIWNRFDQYEDTKACLYTWMLNIARNHTIDMLRSKGYKHRKMIRSDENYVYDLLDDHAVKERFDTIGLRKLLENLKPEQRVLIDMAYFNEYSQDEISKALNIPLGTVKSRIRAALMELRKNKS